MKNITVSVDDETTGRRASKPPSANLGVSAGEEFLDDLRRRGDSNAARQERALRERDHGLSVRPTDCRATSCMTAADDAAFLDTNDPALFDQHRSRSRRTKRGDRRLLWPSATTRCRCRCCRSSMCRRLAPHAPDPLPHEIAVGLIRTWLRFPVSGHHSSDHERRARHQSRRVELSYWDAAIVAAARRSAAASSIRRTCSTAARSAA